MDLNEKFVAQMDEEHEKFSSMLQRFIQDQAKQLLPKAQNIKTQLEKNANIIKFSVSFTLEGKEIVKEKEWTDKELAVSNEPVTKLFVEVMCS